MLQEGIFLFLISNYFRLLVGLKWECDFDEQGNERYYFMCKVDE